MATETAELVKGLEIKGAISPGYEEILSPEALNFVSRLHRKFNVRRKELLNARKERQEQIDRGIFPDFLPETKNIRESDWTVAPLPKDLLDRRVEITGPVDRKMIINALNSGASVFMADFEDSNAPTWANNIEGQINLRDAVNKTIGLQTPDGKTYRLNEKTATLFVRPRGWHLNEKHVHVDGEEMSGSLFDFGLYFFHNAKNLIRKGTAPYFYLPKMESHLEARLWNDVFIYTQQELDIPQGTIKATVLIETILASFEMDEILYELKEHSAGLNCGRWDYIFSFIKKFRKHSSFILPDRAQVTMLSHFMRSYSLLLIKTCHRRGVHAMGGMAAQIPVKNDLQANEAAFAKVRADKEREASDGHDGTWVAHPGLIAVAKEAFDRLMPDANQIKKMRQDVQVTASDLLTVPQGEITEEGFRTNIDIALQYIESWIGGTGCVPIYNLMEDAATAEISRAQLWQWVHNSAALNDGRVISVEFFRSLLPGVLSHLKNLVGEARFNSGRYKEAVEILDKLVTQKEFTEFLTLEAYKYI